MIPPSWLNRVCTLLSWEFPINREVKVFPWGTLVGFSFVTKRTPDHGDVQRDTSGRRRSSLGVFETSYDGERADRFFWPRQEYFGLAVQTRIRKATTGPFPNPFLHRHNVEIPSRYAPAK